MKSLANEFFKTMEDGARRHQAAHAADYELVATGIKDEQDVARQIAIVEQMIARRVNAIVLAPADSKALVGVAKKAVDAGIVVVNIDNRLDRDAMAERGLAVPFVGPDNREGRRGRRRVRRRSGSRRAIRSRSSKARRTRSTASQRDSRIRGRGARGRPGDRAIADRQLGNGPRQPGRLGAGDASGPDVKAILCANDSMALGAVAALKAAGRAGTVLVAGFDNISAVQALITSGDDRRHRRSARRSARRLRHRVRARSASATPAAPLADRETPVDLVTAETPR